MAQEQTHSGQRVLLVDDDKTIRLVASEMLRQCGCEVETAASGWDALTRLAEIKPDLILLDITMEPLDGFKTLTLIRASRDGYADIPVVMLSSHDDVFSIGKSRDLGCSAYLDKPLKMAALRQVLSELLDTRAAM